MLGPFRYNRSIYRLICIQDVTRCLRPRSARQFKGIDDKDHLERGVTSA